MVGNYTTIQKPLENEDAAYRKHFDDRMYQAVLELQGAFVTVEKAFVWHLRGDLAVETQIGPEFEALWDGRLTRWIVTVDPSSVPLSGTTIFDINKNGVSLWPNDPDGRPTLASGSAKNNGNIFDIETFKEGDFFTFDIDQIASTPGSKVSMQLNCEVKVPQMVG